MAQRTTPTLKQARFAKAYAVHGNASAAARAAGYSPVSAHDSGHRNLKKVVVQAEIETWQARLERNITPSLATIEELRDASEDGRIRLAASRDLLNRAGVGKQIEKQTNVLAVFANMDEAKLLEKMTLLAQGKNANVSPEDVSPNI